jgi:calcineurin-like phosphoesterase family protein
MQIAKTNAFFISDTHFWHNNVIKFDNRPFQSIEEMNEELILNWNSVVDNDSVVYFLGDFAFAGITKITEILNKLNGTIHVISGNHDNYKILTKTKRFASIDSYCEIYIPDKDAYEGMQMICMSHYPMVVWNKHHRGSWMLHGHCHQSLINTEIGKLLYIRKIYDVGVNGIGYTPQSYNQIKTIMSDRIIVKVDHHE